MLSGKVGVRVPGEQWGKNLWVGENAWIRSSASLEGRAVMGGDTIVGWGAVLLGHVVVGNGR